MGMGVGLFIRIVKEKQIKGLGGMGVMGIQGVGTMDAALGEDVGIPVEGWRGVVQREGIDCEMD